MGLTTYKKKRAFDQTPEPTGGKAAAGQLRFVVQKHAATRLHYDFRLEMEGVLKSWAIPKGPSLNPEDKRLAMMVEDHPYDYRNFEGIIPEGNYGAGTVIVWDEGTYEPLDLAGNKKADEKTLLRELKSGSLKFTLKGSKLKGEFALVKLKNGREENAWLLIKHRDKFAKETDITKKNKSVVSSKTLEQVTKTSTNIYGKTTIKPGTTPKDKPTATKQKRATAPIKATARKKSRATAAKTPEIPDDAPKTAFPKTISPMLATLIDKPFDQPGWLYEVKWDGYRAIAMNHKGKTELLSRNNKSFNEKFYPVYEAVKAWNTEAIVDGEICVLNEKGIARFGSLQNWRSEADGELVYYVFDLLWLNGYNLMPLALTERRALLKMLVPDSSIIRYSEAFESDAATFLKAAGELGMEGIMAKKADSTYLPGERTQSWLKIKSNKRHEVVIGGFTNNEGSPKLFSALLVGVYEKGKLRYTGKIGTGFNTAMQKEMMARFKPLIRRTCPFTEEPDVNKPSRFRHNPPNATVTWLRPALVGEVSYAEVTSDGVMRHPSFEGMREDKPARKVTEEPIVKTEKALKSAATDGKKSSRKK